MKPRDGDRFADLVPDARRIDPGPSRRPRSPSPDRSERPSEGRTAKRSGGRADSRRSEDAPSPAFRWPAHENRHLAAAPGLSDQQLNRLQRGDPEPEERIDLHGTRLVEAKRLIAKRIASARSQGLRCVLVVHGRGQRSATQEAVLRDALPDWLTLGATARDVLGFAPAPRRLGGDGATLVLLRKTGSARPGRTA